MPSIKMDEDEKRTSNGVSSSDDVFSASAISSDATKMISPNSLTATAVPGPRSPTKRNRAGSRPPPPPIFVRTATDRTIRPRPAGNSPSSPTSHIMVVTGDEDEELPMEEGADTEAGDNLSDLVVTPDRYAFNLERPTTPRGQKTNGDLLTTPTTTAALSPAWRSIDSPSDGSAHSPYATPSRSGNPRPPSWHRNSLEVPGFIPMPSTPERSERRFDPTPHHGLHARNLSAYFPQPGVPRAPPSPSNDGPAGESMIPDGDKTSFGGTSEWEKGGDGTEAEPRRKRRGHHHKHSLSHNFFSFLDPTQTNPALAPPANITHGDDTPHQVPIPFPQQQTSSLSPLPPSKSDPHIQLNGSLALIEFLLGAGLWVNGQISGWRCLAATGYLVVFDAIGLCVNLLATKDREGARGTGLRRPYGSSRYTSLLCFAQAVFLVFASTYIAKEAVEHVILGQGAHDHGGGHGHGHGDHGHGNEKPFPYLLLSLAAIAATISGALLDNHSRLVDATGPLLLPAWYLALPFVGSNKTLSNPYTVTVAGTAAVLFIGSFVVPASSLTNLDSTASLALALLTGCLAFPPTKIFAHVLLQTAPPAASSQMKSLRRALRDVGDDRRVLGLGTLRCWAINAGKVVDDAGGPPSAPGSRRGSVHTRSPSTLAFTQGNDISTLTQAAFAKNAQHQQQNHAVPLVVTLVVHVHPDSSERDVLDVTRSSWSKLSQAVATPGGGSEVTVQVRRGWDGAE